MLQFRNASRTHHPSAVSPGSNMGLVDTNAGSTPAEGMRVFVHSRGHTCLQKNANESGQQDQRAGWIALGSEFGGCKWQRGMSGMPVDGCMHKSPPAHRDPTQTYPNLV